MLSYSWKDKEAVLLLKDELLGRGLQVWFDENYMRSIADDAMADGVLSSMIFVPCLSRHYDISHNALKEFRFASAKKKKMIAVRLENRDRLPFVEFNILPSLWCNFENSDRDQLISAASFIEKEVKLLKGDTILQVSSNLRVIRRSDIEITKPPIGQGGFGTVYEAVLDKIEIVAYKKINDANPTNKAKNSFVKEAQIMEKLAHPRIIRIFGVVDEPNIQEIGIVMEFMSGGSLYHLISDREPLPIGLRVQILLDVSVGVEFLHKVNILHRDLKSMNILLDQNLRAKVADFGLAVLKMETKSKTRTEVDVTGTKLYKAPEFFKGFSVKSTEKTDVFAFSVI
ncbi:hypothetical protein HK096_008681, partial [Nowakowskiella sp. JEL0078]